MLSNLDRQLREPDVIAQAIDDNRDLGEPLPRQLRRGRRIEHAEHHVSLSASAEEALAHESARSCTGRDGE